MDKMEVCILTHTSVLDFFQQTLLKYSVSTFLVKGDTAVNETNKNVFSHGAYI